MYHPSKSRMWGVEDGVVGSGRKAGEEGRGVTGLAGEFGVNSNRLNVGRRRQGKFWGFTQLVLWLAGTNKAGIKHHFEYTKDCNNIIILRLANVHSQRFNNPPGPFIPEKLLASGLSRTPAVKFTATAIPTQPLSVLDDYLLLKQQQQKQELQQQFWVSCIWLSSYLYRFRYWVCPLGALQWNKVTNVHVADPYNVADSVVMPAKSLKRRMKLILRQQSRNTIHMHIQVNKRGKSLLITRNSTRRAVDGTDTGAIAGGDDRAKVSVPVSATEIPISARPTNEKGKSSRQALLERDFCKLSCLFGKEDPVKRVSGRGRRAESSFSSSPALKGKGELSTNLSEAMDFTDWCQCESVRLMGTKDTSFLEFCLKHQKQRCY
uniref:Uncharacterized protein n=1 Tax=Tanacetum cinerariifolium TaxID=118510 RepID=A0A6L2MQ84_TANCI|nr:hypothetical protein [Tanacetum cinerariifolium]